jgi:hypothetical protein
MIGAINTDRADTTPRKDGMLGGSPWAAIGTGSSAVALGPQIPCPASAERTLRVSYEVRGRYATTGDILVVGQANITIPDGSDPVVTEDVRTFDHSRVTIYAGVDYVQLQVAQHASEDWEFMGKVAYDLLEPLPVET